MNHYIYSRRDIFSSFQTKYMGKYKVRVPTWPASVTCRTKQLSSIMQQMAESYFIVMKCNADKNLRESSLIEQQAEPPSSVRLMSSSPSVIPSTYRGIRLLLEHVRK